MHTLGYSILSCLCCRSLPSKTRNRERCESACNESQKAARSKLYLALISRRNSINLPLRPPTPRGCFCERQWTRVGWARVTGINCVFLLTRVISAHVGEFSVEKNCSLKEAASNSRITGSFQTYHFACYTTHITLATIGVYTGCPRRNGQNFGRVFLMLKYTDIIQNTYYPKLNGYGDNGQRSLKLWQLLHTYWLPNSY